MAPSPPLDSAVLIPMKLDAFILNKKVCSGGEHEAKIAPITQPNYTHLRYQKRYLAPDVLRHVDLHSSTPASSNSRFTNLGTKVPHANRQGVYLHWIVPRPYRTAVGRTEEPKDPNEKKKDGEEKVDVTAVEYFEVPVRWLVLRKLDTESTVPKLSEELAKKNKWRGWVIESNRKFEIDELKADVDLQVDVSPYTTAVDDGDVTKIAIDISKQAEIFIGAKFEAKGWKEKTGVKRVPLNVFNSSNQLFADYQPHNTNVFSMVDKVEYLDAKNNPQRFTHAKASYYVLGWHDDKAKDLFNLETSHTDAKTRGKQVESLRMAINDLPNEEYKAWRESTLPSSSLCHGAMYDVVWDNEKKPDYVPADDACKNLMESPIAVGTTPMDAIMAYVKGHNTTSTGPIHDLETNLLKLQSLLIDRDEGVEPQRRALNILTNLNFQRVEGGKQYFLAAPKEQDAAGVMKESTTYVPVQEDKDAVQDFNKSQRQLDAQERIFRKRQWDLFAAWWKFLTDIDAKEDNPLQKHQKSRTDLTTFLQGLNKKKTSAFAELFDKTKKFQKTQDGVSQPFFQNGDPTVLTAGVKAAWPTDFLENLQVRLRNQVVGAFKEGTQVEVKLDDDVDDLVKTIPYRFLSDARFLINEFINNQTDTTTPEKPVLPPLYHDTKTHPGNPKIAVRWRDRWHDTQAWFPLFLEWEVDYVHLKYDLWKMDDGEKTADQRADGKVRYRVDKAEVSDPDIDGTRRISGRVLLLPQPVFSLKSKIKQLFADTPSGVLEEALLNDEEKKLEDEKRKVALKKKQDAILDTIDEMGLLSSPLAGFTSHLLTRLDGTHVKPTYRQPPIKGQKGQVPKAIGQAREVAKDAGYVDLDLEYMGLETDLTPYGTTLSFDHEAPSPFKPVTHGQFRFRKFNIIDKFGQAIHALDPTNVVDPQALQPFTSEYYTPQQLLKRKAPDTKPADGVKPKVDYSKYEFIQVPPQINQPARLNAHFVTLKTRPHGRHEVENYWEPVGEWDSPIWGWVVINYANYGLQFFLSDGTFYREVRLGGPKGSQESPKWLPGPPNPDELVDAKQLQKLIDELGDAEYLARFIEMINLAMKKMLPAPGAYAEFMSALIGHPLALVNMGWSLELATEALQSQSSISNPYITKLLTPPAGGSADPARLYKFPLKLGDGMKNYDGLLGYWKSCGIDDHDMIAGDSLDLKKLYTFHYTQRPTYTKNQVVPIDASQHTPLYPYWENPDDYTQPLNYHVANCKKMAVFGAIVDPFTPVHGYTGSVLPVRELKLAPWTWQRAFEKMNVFFHMGPMLVTQDVPEHHAPAQGGGAALSGEEKKYEVKIPALATAKWEWLQPYPKEGGTQLEEWIEYEHFDVGAMEEKIMFEETRSVAIEGYLQVKKQAKAA
jgi:hypothetical protein